MSQLMDKGIIFSSATAVSWAIAVILMRKAGDTVRPLPMNIIRYSIAIIGFVLTLPFFPQEAFPNLSFWDWVRIVGSGILGGAFGDLFYLGALNRIGAGTLAILDLAYLPTMAIFAWIIFGDTMGPQAITGAGLVAVGVALATLSLRRTKGTKAIRSKEATLGIVFAFSALASVIACALMIGDLIRTESILWISIVRYVAATLSLFAVVRWKGWGPEVSSAIRSKRRRNAIVVSAIFGAYGASLLWFLGFKHSQIGVASALNQTSSLFILLLARIFLDESLNLRKWLAIGVGLTGAILVGTA